MEKEEEGEVYSIPDLIKTIREANITGMKLLYLFYDKCPEMALKNVKIGNKYLSYIHISCFELVENQYYSEEPNKYFTKELYAKIDPSEINKTDAIGIKSKKKYVRYNFHKIISPENAFGNSSLSDSVLFYFAVPKEEAEDFEEYLFAKNRREIIIEKALKEMEQYIGFPYAYGGGANRTSLDSVGTAEMDCSEFMSRFIQKACGLEKVPGYTTTLMKNWIRNKKYGDDNLEYLDGSKDKKFKNIQPGDVFLWWTEEKGGHTGVIVSYDSTTDLVTVIEAIGENGSREESLSKNLTGYCKDCIRISVYTRTGASLADHDGWEGYFRPKIK